MYLTFIIDKDTMDYKIDHQQIRPRAIVKTNRLIIQTNHAFQKLNQLNKFQVSTKNQVHNMPMFLPRVIHVYTYNAYDLGNIGSRPYHDIH